MQDTNHILIALVTIYGVSVLLQISVLAGLAILAMKAMKMAKEYADEAKQCATDLSTKVIPVLSSTLQTMEHAKALITRLEPKLDAAATDLAEISRVAREETARITASADEITNRVRRQAERVDDMATTALNGVDRVGHFLNECVNQPVRQVSGILAAARAVISTLRDSSSQPPPAPDEDVTPESRRYA